MVDLLHNERTDVWRLFLETHALVLGKLRLRSQQDGAEIPLEWFDVLIHLNDSPDARLRMVDLAESLALIPSNITRLIDRMESCDFVERKPCPEDRRVTYTAITSRGKEALAQMIPENRRRVMDIFLNHLSDEDVKALGQALSKVYEANKE